MQEASNSPFGGKTGITKQMFVEKVKARDAATQYDTQLSLKVKPTT